MSAAIVFGVIATAQLAFLVLLLVFVMVRRAYDRRQRAVFLAARAGVGEPLRAWLVAGAHPESVVRAMRALPRGTAVGYVALLARQTIPADQRDELAEALRGEQWIATALRQRTSRFWWRRLEAARALTLVGGPRDRDAVRVLLEDPHPAVQIAAVAALLRVADEDLMGLVFDRLFGMPKVVRQYLTSVLAQARHVIGGTLAGRVRAGAEPIALASWIELAEAVDDGPALAEAVRYAGHPAETVRRTVARALRRRPAADTQAALVRLLGDPAPAVRAAAARSLGELGLVLTVASLAPLLTDAVWSVRLRAAVALAQLGEAGRDVLRRARAGTDRFARDMAALVSGLSDGALLELDDA